MARHAGAAATVMLCCDDAQMRLAWTAQLEAEGLHVAAGDGPAEGGSPGGGEPAAACVLHISGGLAPQLPRLRALRSLRPRQPLLVALRGLRDLDQVLALEMGADDVVDATTAAPVLAARLRALWRRMATAGVVDEPQELQFGALRLSRATRRVSIGERRVPLTEGEFAVLWLLAVNAGRTLRREEILRRVRGLDDHPTDRSIDCRVYRIRAKLDDNRRAEPCIRTVRHLGYAFVATVW